MKKKMSMFLSLMFLSSIVLVGCGSTNCDVTSGTEGTSLITGDTTVWTITYHLNYDEEGVYTTKTIKHGKDISTIRPEDPKRDGYVFRGWCVDEEGLFVYTGNVTSNVDLYARWNVRTTIDTGSTPNGSSSENNSSENPVTGITYTITNLPNWITNDGCQVFAWVWSPTNSGEWIQTIYDASDSTNIKTQFTIDEDITGMLLARCAPNTIMPDWKITDHVPGRVYNQTEDIEIKSGVTTYSCSTWKEYNPV